MANVFRVPEDKRDEVAKTVAKFERKAAKYGTPFSVTFGEPYAADIPVRKVDEITQTIRTVDTVKVEVFDLTIEADVIRKDGYDVVARIEHLVGGNVVAAFGNVEVKDAWRTAKGVCEHCGVNHNRKVTFIVRRDWKDVQVGSTCLADYCGINPLAIGWRNELVEFLEGEDLREYDFERHPEANAFDVTEALALAIEAIKSQGYVKSSERGSNKEFISDRIMRYSFTEAQMVEAESMKKAIAAIDRDEAWREGLSDIQSIVKSGYCKANHFGYIAYAPVAYKKYLESVEKRAAWEAEKAVERQSEYVGEVGERIEVDVASMRLVTTFAGQWGSTYLYKFVDKDGNVFVWFSSGLFGHWATMNDYVPYENVSKIRATIKGHNERDGVKQTVITRVKAA